MVVVGTEGDCLTHSCVLPGLTRGVHDLIWQGIRGGIRKESCVAALEELVVSW